MGPGFSIPFPLLLSGENPCLVLMFWLRRLVAKRLHPVRTCANTRGRRFRFLGAAKALVVPMCLVAALVVAGCLEQPCPECDPHGCIPTGWHGAWQQPGVFDRLSANASVAGFLVEFEPVSSLLATVGEPWTQEWGGGTFALHHVARERDVAPSGWMYASLQFDSLTVRGEGTFDQMGFRAFVGEFVENVTLANAAQRASIVDEVIQRRAYGVNHSLLTAEFAKGLNVTEARGGTGEEYVYAEGGWSLWFLISTMSVMGEGIRLRVDESSRIWIELDRSAAPRLEDAWSRTNETFASLDLGVPDIGAPGFAETMACS